MEVVVAIKFTAKSDKVCSFRNKYYLCYLRNVLIMNKGITVFH
jgi:hypothetical protein